MPKFERSTRKNKKYSVTTPSGKTIHFGAIENGVPMGQYRDNTGLGLYSKYDHNDKKRRANYLARAKGIKDKNGKLTWKDKESPNYYSIKFLWM